MPQCVQAQGRVHISIIISLRTGTVGDASQPALCTQITQQTNKEEQTKQSRIIRGTEAMGTFLQ